MKQQPDATEHATNDTDGEAPAQQEPDTTTAIQEAPDRQAATGKQRIHFPFGDYEIWP